MRELKTYEAEQVSGGIWQWFASYFAGKAVDSYAGWVSGGAGGWEEEYNGVGYSDPLL